MSDVAAQVANPEPQAGDGQVEQESVRTPLTAEQLAAALADTRKEAAEYRRKLREAEAKAAEAERAKAAEAERVAAEQGQFRELYEAEKVRAATAAERLAQLERDMMRKEAASAAGIPQLWQRLQGSTAEELAEDARQLAAMMQPVAAGNGTAGRLPTTPTPAPQGISGLTPEERRARAVRTF